MLALRTPVVPAAVLAGLALGALAWLAAGRQDRLEPLRAQLAALRPAREAERTSVSSGLSGTPLFALSIGPNAVKDPAVTVLGVSRMPGRSAALLNIDGQTAWLTLGESRDGVILREVGAGRALLDLPLGLKDLSIGEGDAPAASAQALAGSVPGRSQSNDGPPSGFRMPPPPASAPSPGE